MTNVRIVLLVGLLGGMLGISGLGYLLWVDSPQLVLFPALQMIAVGVVIGVLAAMTGRQEALKAAALSGFVAGFLIAMFGMIMVFRSPSLIGPKPFSSAEAFFSFMGSALVALVFNSWLLAGIACLSTLPIRLSFHARRAAS